MSEEKDEDAKKTYPVKQLTDQQELFISSDVDISCWGINLPFNYTTPKKAPNTPSVYESPRILIRSGSEVIRSEYDWYNIFVPMSFDSKSGKTKYVCKIPINPELSERELSNLYKVCRLVFHAHKKYSFEINPFQNITKSEQQEKGLSNYFVYSIPITFLYRKRNDTEHSYIITLFEGGKDLGSWKIEYKLMFDKHKKNIYCIYMDVAKEI